MDASGSMQVLIGSGRSRFTVAKEAIITLTSELSSDTEATLWVYGHRLNQTDPEASCQDIEQVIPLGRIDPAAYAEAVTPLNAIGYTPIATTLQMAADSLPTDSPKLIVLMSDGEESCGGDPCAVAQTLEAGGFELVVNTIGFAADAETRAQLQCIADVTGGTYYEAQNAGALIDSLREASVPVIPTAVPTVVRPTSTPLPTDTPLPSATFTPPPTSTLLPTDTPLPSATFTPPPSSTPLPTDTPPPTNTPEPLGEAEGERPFTVSPDAIAESRSENPQAVIDGGGNLHVVWLETVTRANGTGDLLHRVRSPEGFWSPVTNLSGVFGSWLSSTYSLLRRTDGVVCVYMDGAPGETQVIEVQRRCLIDGTWLDPEAAPEFTLTNGNYALAYDAAGVLQGVVNRSNTVYTVSTNEALGNGYFGLTEQFAIDAAGGYHAIWLGISGINFTLQYRYSQDGGVTWTAEESLTENPDVRQETQPQIVAGAQGNVHLLYTASESGSRIEYRQWTPEGGWGERVVIAQTGSESLPELAVDADGLAYAAWYNVDGVSYSYQHPDGTWTIPVHAIDALVAGSGAALAVDRYGTIHFVWDDGMEDRIRYTQFDRVD
jgi:hypothetical protein